MFDLWISTVKLIAAFVMKYTKVESGRLNFVEFTGGRRPGPLLPPRSIR